MAQVQEQQEQQEQQVLAQLEQVQASINSNNNTNNSHLNNSNHLSNNSNFNNNNNNTNNSHLFLTNQVKALMEPEQLVLPVPEQQAQGLLELLETPTTNHTPKPMEMPLLVINNLLVILVVFRTDHSTILHQSIMVTLVVINNCNNNQVINLNKVVPLVEDSTLVTVINTNNNK